MFVAPEARSEPVATMDLDKVIEQGVQAVFERESIVRTDLLVGEIVRLAPGQASNSEIEAALKNRDEFVRKKVGDHEMITTRAIIAEEQAIIDGVKAGMGKKEALVSEAEYQTPAELKVSYDGLAGICDDARAKGRRDDAGAGRPLASAARSGQPVRDDEHGPIPEYPRRRRCGENLFHGAAGASLARRRPSGNAGCALRRAEPGHAESRSGESKPGRTWRERLPRRIPLPGS